jgi:hypothetical protein
MALLSRNSSIQSFCSLTRSGWVAPSCQVSKNDSTSALSGSVPGLKGVRPLGRCIYTLGPCLALERRQRARQRQRGLARIAEQHRELPSSTGSRSVAAASAVSTSTVSRARPKK